MREIHKHLNERQREIISNPRGVKLIISGPGTGKTATLISYISEVILSGLAKPEQIMAVTFTNRAADEMQERVSKAIGQNVYIATLHSFAAQVLRRYPPAGFTPGYKIMDEPRQYAVIAQIAKELGLKDHPAYIIEKLTLACNLRDRTMLVALNFEDLYRKYASHKKQNNLFDYDDLLVWCAHTFENNLQALSHYQKQFTYILVDEYQDINPVQHTILKMLARHHNSFVAVGDFDQSIYGFRGADVNIMLNFSKDFPECKTYFLEQNYRSTRRIIAAANILIKHNGNRMDKPLFTLRETGTAPVTQSFGDERMEASQVASIIQDGVKHGKKYCDYAVLYRVNVLSRAYEEVFASLGIPYQVFGGPGFFQRNEIQNILSFFRLRQDPENKTALVRAAAMIAEISGEAPKKMALLVEKSGAALHDQFLYSSKEYLKIIPTVIKSIEPISNLEEIYDVILQQTGYLDYLKQNQSTEGLRRVENVEELRSTLIKFGGSGKSADSFLAFVDRVHSQKETNAVKLMTSHAAKGTEFDTVFIVAAEEGMFPHYNAETEAQLEEERRIFYVSVTRSKNQLFIFHSTSRMNRGKVIKVSPSPYIKELQTVDSFNPVPKPVRGKKANKSYGNKGLAKEHVCEGLIVYHATFGKGVITEVRDALPNYTEVDIIFGATKRKIILEYAPLTAY